MMIDGWPVKVILKGDSTAAGALLPYAGNVLRQMNNARIMNKVVKVGDATLRLRIDKYAKLMLAEIEAGAQYMESCYQDLLSVTRVDEDFYRPATATLNSTALALPTIPQNASTTRKLVEGDISWAAGQRSLRKTVDTTVGAVPVVFSSDDPAYCNPAMIANMKLTRNMVPPSTYTGLMRKYVQALYGTDRRDYIRAKNPSGVGYHLVVSSKKGSDYSSIDVDEANPSFPDSAVHIQNVMQSSGILYDSASGDHVFITASTTAISYRVMRVVTPADVPNWTTEEEHIRYLSALSPGKAELQVAVDMSALADYFFPAYSWKFNSDGTEAIGVLFKYNYGLSEEPLGFLTTIARLSFSYAAGVLSATLTRDAETPYAPSSAYAFMVPFKSDSGDAMLHVWQLYQGPPTPTGTAPVYAFYGAGDSEVVSTVTFGGDLDITTSEPTSSNFHTRSAELFGGSGPPVGGGTLTTSGTETPGQRVSAEYGVTAGGVEYLGNLSSDNGNRAASTRTVTCGGIVYGPEAAWQPGFFRPGIDISQSDYSRYSDYYSTVWAPIGRPFTPEEIAERNYKTTMGIAYASDNQVIGPGTTASSVTTYEFQRSESDYMILSVPWDDASAIISGKISTMTNGGSATYTSNRYGNNSAWWYKTKNDSFMCPATWMVFGDLIYADTTSDIKPPSSIGTTEFSVITANTVDSFSMGDDETAAASNILDSIFTPGANIDPVVPYRMSVKKAAVSDDRRWVIAADIGAEGRFGEWPDKTFAIPSGVT